MKSFKPLLALATIFVACSANAGDPAICELRSAFLGSVAQERDKGVKKEKVKKMLPKKLAEMSPWIDVVYDQTKGMTPNEVAGIVKLACLKE